MNSHDLNSAPQHSQAFGQTPRVAITYWLRQLKIPRDSQSRYKHSHLTYAPRSSSDCTGIIWFGVEAPHLLQVCISFLCELLVTRRNLVRHGVMQSEHG
jgi:hypothetical protein